MAENDITAISDWLKKRKISEDVVKTLVKVGYTSMEVLAMLTGEDITDINAAWSDKDTEDPPFFHSVLNTLKAKLQMKTRYVRQLFKCYSRL